MKKRFTHCITILLMLGFCASFQSLAQTTSNSGTNFWVGWTGHIDGSNSQMSLYITSNVNTTATVSIPSMGITNSYNITANSVTIAAIPKSAYVGTSEVIENKGIQVVSEQPIVVYSHIYASARSAATLVLPTNTLGKEYYASSYTQNVSNQFSEFMVIGTEDNTVVEITPKATTRLGRPENVPFKVTLNKGEVYQVQANTDLTGSKIVSVSESGPSCKKIAVFSGSSFVGIGCTNAGTKDNLYQQLYPLSTWGRNFVTAPFKTRLGGDVFRAIAASNNTTVTINGISRVVNAGEFYEFTSDIPNYVISDKPITLAQYARTQGCDNITGDPEMIIINPVEQTLEDITLYSSPYYQITGHYINVIMKTVDTPSFRLDGSPVTFSVVSTNPEYSYAQVTVNSGNHRLTASAGFNAIAYGFGNVESYGYAAGANIKSLEQYISADQNSFCGPGTVNFKANLTYTPTSLKWYFSDNTTSAQTNPTKTFANPGKYKATLVTTRPNNIDCESKDSTSYEIVINPIVTANAGPDLVICSGDKVTLGQTAVAGITYSWSPATGLSASNIANPTFQLTNTGTTNIVQKLYFDAVNAATKCSARDSVTITIKPALTREAGPDVTICSGDKATIGLPGLNGYTYSWNPATGLVNSNAAQTTAQLINTTGKVDRNQYIRFATFNNCTVSDTVIITVKPAPTAQAGTDKVTCSGTPVTIGSASQSGHTYTWSPAVGLSSTSVSNPTVTLTNNTQLPISYTYTVTATLDGCISTDQVVILINPTPIADAGADVAICTGSSTVLSATGGVSYSWSPAAGLSATNVAKPTASPTATTTYTVTVTDANGCVSTDQVVVTVNPLPTAKMIGSASVCPNIRGVSYQIEAPQDFTFKWSVKGGQIASGTNSAISVNWGETNSEALVYAIPTNKFGCVGDTVKFKVIINQLLTPETPKGPELLCRQDKSNVEYKVQVTNGSVYTWHIRGGQIISGQGTNQVRVNWGESGKGKLWLNEESITATDRCFGTSDTLFFKLVPNTTALAITSVGTEPANDKNILVKYSISTSDAYPANKTFDLQRKLPTNISWQTIASLPLSSSQFVDATQQTSQLSFEYRLTGTNTCDSVLVSPTHDTILLSGKPQEGRDGNIQVQWNAYRGWAQEPVRYEIWKKIDSAAAFSLDQSITSASNSVSLTLPIEGFLQCYRIRAVSGNKESWSNIICIDVENTLVVPNVITPNGDGKNDHFEVTNLQFYPGSQLKVFNRWGKEVFSSNDYRGDWDAKNLPVGIYYYQLTTKVKSRTIKGWVEVIR